MRAVISFLEDDGSPQIFILRSYPNSDTFGNTWMATFWGRFPDRINLSTLLFISTFQNKIKI